MLVEVAVEDNELYSRFTAGVPEVIKKYGGSFVLRSTGVTTVIGDWKPDKITLIKFNTIDELRECFNSKEYKELAEYREKSAVTQARIIEV